MAYENIQIQHGNLTIDRNFVFYTMDHVGGTLISKTSVGAPVQTYTLETTIREVLSIQFDGYYYWSLEQPITNGFRVRKWEIGADDIVRVIDDHLYSPDSINSYDVNAIAVEAYIDSLDNQEVPGTTSFDVVDGQVVRIGDSIILGPSTATGFIGIYNFTTVINKVGNTLTVNVPLNVVFSPGDPIVFSRNFFAFSNTAPSNLDGALYMYDASNGNPLSMDVSNMYNLVSAATFFKNKLMFIRGSEVIWLNPDTKDINRSQAINNATTNRSGYVTTYDLAGDSETLYRLEQEHVYYNDGFNRWESENWSPLYNWNTSGVVPEIFFVGLKAHPQILHIHTSDLAVDDPDALDSEIVVTVLDQFRTPVFNRIVDFTSNGGPLSSTQEVTDENGQVRTTYTASSFSGDVTITAEVT